MVQNADVYKAIKEIHTYLVHQVYLRYFFNNLFMYCTRINNYINIYNNTFFLNILLVTGCRSNKECSTNEACINGKCSNPCRCGPNAVCDVVNHKATCKCLAGYNGNPLLGCQGNY